MYLCRTSVNRDGRQWEMCGVIPAETVMESRLHRLGYVEARTASPGLFGPAGTVFRGHEFHWSSMNLDVSPQPVVEIRKPGLNAVQPEGFRLKNVWGTYVHAHFASNPDIPAHWAAFLSSLS
jgi:cobyrinic acid a,c-diamide synthase